MFRLLETDVMMVLTSVFLSLLFPQIKSITIPFPMSSSLNWPEVAGASSFHITAVSQSGSGASLVSPLLCSLFSIVRFHHLHEFNILELPIYLLRFILYISLSVRP